MQTEKQIEAYLRVQVKGMGGKAYKFVSPGNAGVPDRMVVLPDGNIIFVELKTKVGKLTALQLKSIAQFRAMGCDVFIARSTEDVDQMLAWSREGR